MEDWKEFYSWLSINGYHVYRHQNIFRGNNFILDFDPQEDHDSGEINETIVRIRAEDHWNF